MKRGRGKGDERLTPHQRPHAADQIYEFPLDARALVVAAAAEGWFYGRVAPADCGCGTNVSDPDQVVVWMLFRETG